MVIVSGSSHSWIVTLDIVSRQVIAGEIGAGPMGYTAIGEQVGMAQRMESVAPPGGVMLSASTAHLVEQSTALGEIELVRIKGASDFVRVRRLLGVSDQPVSTATSALSVSQQMRQLKRANHRFTEPGQPHDYHDNQLSASRSHTNSGGAQHDNEYDGFYW